MSTASASEPVQAIDPAKDWPQFFELHKAQLEHMKLPKSLWKSMHAKLVTNKRLDDAGEPFIVEKAPAEVSGFQLRAKKSLKRWSEVWIVPHLISGTKTELLNALVTDPKGCKYIWNMMDLDNVVEGNLEDDIPENATESQVETAQDVKQENGTDVAPVKTDKVEESSPEKQEPSIAADPVMVEVLMSQIEGLTREKAEAALIETNNDLLEAIHVAGPRTELHDLSDQADKKYSNAMGNTTSIESAEKRQAEKKKAKELANVEGENKEESKKEGESEIKQSASSAATTKVLSREEIINIRRAKVVFECLFRFGYVGSYFVAKPRDVEGAITQDEVITKYFVMSPMGSAIGVAEEPNVKVASFVCLTLNNASFSIMWPERDIKDKDLISRAPFNVI